HCIRRRCARRDGEHPRCDRRRAADRGGAGHRGGLLDRGFGCCDLSRDGRDPRVPPAGAVRNPVSRAMSRATLAMLAAVVLLPIVVRPVIASEIWIFAIFGLGANLLMGYTGLLSFGQATFFGSGAYVAGYLLKHYGIDVFAALGVGIGVGAFSALLVGYLCVQ